MRENKNYRANYLTKLEVDLDGIWYTVETDEISFALYLVQLIFKGENPTCVIPLLRERQTDRFNVG